MKPPTGVLRGLRTIERAAADTRPSRWGAAAACSLPALLDRQVGDPGRFTRRIWRLREEVRPVRSRGVEPLAWMPQFLAPPCSHQSKGARRGERTCRTGSLHRLSRDSRSAAVGTLRAGLVVIRLDAPPANNESCDEKCRAQADGNSRPTTFSVGGPGALPVVGRSGTNDSRLLAVQLLLAGCRRDGMRRRS